jgi:hypothetical protein
VLPPGLRLAAQQHIIAGKRQRRIPEFRDASRSALASRPARAATSARSSAITRSRSANRPGNSACGSASYPVTSPRSAHQPSRRTHPSRPACRLASLQNQRARDLP